MIDILKAVNYVFKKKSLFMESVYILKR